MNYITYDIENIKLVACKKLKKTTLILFVFLTLFTSSLILFILYHLIALVFIITLIVALLSLVMIIKQIAILTSIYYSNIEGDIIDVYKDITEHHVVASYGMWWKRKYDHFTKYLGRLTVYISSEDQVLSYRFNISSSELEAYYELRGEAIHFFATRYPVKKYSFNNKWLCPICGEFNQQEEKTCSKCKNIIIK